MLSAHVSTMKEDQDLDILNGNGNSLPHPETLIRNSKGKSADASARNNVNEAGEDNSDRILDVNGNSLPHPDEMLSAHVSTMKEDHDLDILNGNGNSLPHPETLMRNSKGKSASTRNNDVTEISDDGSAGILDEDGNSLPHRDAIRPSEGATRNNSLGALDENGNSLPHPETLMGMSTANCLDELEADAVERDSDSTDSSDDDSSSDSGGGLDDNGNSLPHPETMLVSAAAPRTRTASSLFGNLRRSVMSSIPGIRNKSPSGIESMTSHDRDDFRDEENAAVGIEATPNNNSNMAAAILVQSNDGVHATPPTSGSLTETSRDSYFTIEDVESDPIDDLLNTDDHGNYLHPPAENASRRSLGRRSGVSLDENGNSLPPPEGIFPAEVSQNNGSNRWRSIGKSLRSSWNSRTPTSSHSNAASLYDGGYNTEDDPYVDTTYTNDEEHGRMSGTSHSHRAVEDNFNDFPVAYEVDAFNDENPESENSLSCLNRSKKERIQNMLTERNIDLRRCCFIFAMFLIFLGMFIPLVVLSVERRKGRTIETFPPVATVAPTTALTTAPMFDSDCVDEIVLVDENGNDLEDENIGSNIFSGDGYSGVCYTTQKPIRYRLKRCNPLALDWLGIFPPGSLLMDKLWKPFYAGTYLCDGQPCPAEAGNGPMTRESIAPPITEPGEYRFFLVKSSDWPYKYATYSLSIRVVAVEDQCQISPIPVQVEPNAPVDVSDAPKDDDFGDQVGDFVGDLTGDEEFGDQVGDMIGDAVDGIGDIFNINT